MPDKNYSIENQFLASRQRAYGTMAAAVVPNVLYMRKDTIRESFSDFTNNEHRLEKVANVGGIEFINDSKATNVNSSWYSLESTNKPTVWIAGGIRQQPNFNILIPLVEKKVKSIVVLGPETRNLHEAFGKKVGMIISVGSMKEAVELSYHLSNKGDCVLFSPACASFDMYEDYSHRGRDFKLHVKNL